MDFSDKIDNIELKIRQLALKMGRLQEENATLKGENDNLKAEIDRQKGTVDALKDKLSKTQGVLEQQREGQTEYSKQLKQQIDQYISEIDRCIEWLNNNE